MVSARCGFKIPAAVIFVLLKNRYAACVLAQSPQASLIGEAGEFASCDAVLIKRRLSRLSARSALANSCCTQSVALVPGSTPFGSCSRRALFGTLLDASRHMMRRVQSYQTKIIVSSDCLVRRAQRVPGLDFVCNRKYRCCLTTGCSGGAAAPSAAPER